MRIDSAVTEGMIHEPTDSQLLWDGARIMIRLLKQAQSLNGAPNIAFCNHRRVAKKRALAIIYARGKDKKARLYRDLIGVTQQTINYLKQAKIALNKAPVDALQHIE